MKTYIYFPIRELTSSTQNAINHINRLANHSNKSFNLFFDPHNPKRIRLHSCYGVIQRASFLLTERTPSIESDVKKFNVLVSKNPLMLAVCIENTVCITIVVDD